MGILSKFRRKPESWTKAIKRNYKEDPTKVIALGATLGSLGIGATNLAVNTSRHIDATKYQKKQLEAMNRLTDRLGNVSNSMEKMTNSMGEYQNQLKEYQKSSKGKSDYDDDNKIKRKRKRGLFEGWFSEDDSTSIFKSALNGSWVGSTMAGLGTASGFGGATPASKLAFLGGGLLVGAALGALYGSLKVSTAGNSRANVGNNRLLPRVFENLHKIGFKEGKDFVRSPKEANMLKTKVCIVVTRVNGDLKLLVNSARDSKLQRVVENIHIPNTSVTTTNKSDRYNDITISSISDGSADAGLVTGLCEYFIRSGFPVYLIEA